MIAGPRTQHDRAASFGPSGFADASRASHHPIRAIRIIVRVATIQVVRGDITTMNVDAIVNAANEVLLPGGGVCGAIHAAAGPRLATACQAIGHCPTGDAVTTEAYDLPSRYVIHAVGPVWHGGASGEEQALADCYSAILREAVAVDARTLAIPAISTGIYGFPLERACQIAVATLRRALDPESEMVVSLVAFDGTTAACLEAALQ